MDIHKKTIEIFSKENSTPEFIKLCEMSTCRPNGDNFGVFWISYNRPVYVKSKLSREMMDVYITRNQIAIRQSILSHVHAKINIRSWFTSHHGKNWIESSCDGSLAWIPYGSDMQHEMWEMERSAPRDIR